MKLSTLLVASLLALLRGAVVAFLEENYDDCVCSTLSTQCYDMEKQDECCPGYTCQWLFSNSMSEEMSCDVDPDLDTNNCELLFDSCKKDKDCCTGTNCSDGQCVPNDANTGCTSLSSFASEDEDCADIVLLLKDGSTDFGNMPIAIVSQNTSQVTFEVSHQWKEEC